MKNFKLFLLLFIVAASIFGCNNEKTDIKGLVDRFADLECRAMSLRERRFELANQLRFTQDTLLASTAVKDTLRLKLKLESFNKEKDILLQQSLSLADSIKNTLNDIMKNSLTKAEDKHAFNEALNQTLIEKGCIKKS